MAPSGPSHLVAKTTTSTAQIRVPFALPAPASKERRLDGFGDRPCTSGFHATRHSGVKHDPRRTHCSFRLVPAAKRSAERLPHPTCEAAATRTRAALARVVRRGMTLLTSDVKVAGASSGAARPAASPWRTRLLRRP